MALVEQPIAIATTIALRNAARVWMREGLRSSHTIPTMRRPLSLARRMCPLSAAGIDEPPGRTMPTASAMAVIVLAVPIVMQVPALRAMPASTPSQSRSVMFPARNSSQYFQLSDPEPSVLPCQLPRSIGPAGHVDRGDVHAGGTEHQPRRGLVAAAQQHRAVDGVRAQQFLGLHCEQVAVEHRRGFDEALADRHRGQFDGHAARHQDPALHVLGALAQMRVARIDPGPGVDDRDDRAARPLLRRPAHLHRARAMAERSKVGGSEPAGGSKVLRGLPSCVHGCQQTPIGLPGQAARIREADVSALRTICQLWHQQTSSDVISWRPQPLARSPSVSRPPTQSRLRPPRPFQRHRCRTSPFA